MGVECHVLTVLSRYRSKVGFPTLVYLRRRTTSIHCRHRSHHEDMYHLYLVTRAATSTTVLYRTMLEVDSTGTGQELIQCCVHSVSYTCKNNRILISSDKARYLL